MPVGDRKEHVKEDENPHRLSFHGITPHDTETFCPRSHGMSAHMAVLTLAGVCHKWHEAILHTPAFWTHISLQPTLRELRSSIATSIHNYPARLVLQLERAKSAPLEIRWLVSGEPHPQTALYGTVDCPSYWTKLIETTALKLKVLGLGTKYTSLLQSDLSNTARRVSKLISA